MSFNLKPTDHQVKVIIFKKVVNLAQLPVHQIFINLLKMRKMYAKMVLYIKKDANNEI